MQLRRHLDLEEYLWSNKQNISLLVKGISSYFRLYFIVGVPQSFHVQKQSM